MSVNRAVIYTCPVCDRELVVTHPKSLPTFHFAFDSQGRRFECDGKWVPHTTPRRTHP